MNTLALIGLYQSTRVPGPVRPGPMVGITLSWNSNMYMYVPHFVFYFCGYEVRIY